MGIALRVLFLVGVLFVRPLLFAWSASTLWRWFVERDLGPGPSYACWYGIFAIASILPFKHIPKSSDGAKRSTTDLKASLDKVIESALVVAWLPLVALGLAWLYASIVGWL